MTPTVLHHTIRGRNLLRLEWIRRAFHRHDPEGVGAARVDELCRALENADAVLIDPRFGRWCAEIVSLLDRNAAVLLPEGRFRAACRDAGAFALAARSLAGRASTTIVRADHNGEVHLPGTSWVISFGATSAGLDVPVEVCDGLLICAGSVISVASVVPGLALEAQDTVDTGLISAEPLLMTAPPSVVVERGATGPEVSSVPGIARVPAQASSATRTRHVLAAAAHLRAVAQETVLFEPGTSVPEPPPELAEIADAPHLIRLLTLAATEDGNGRLLGLFADWLAQGHLSPHGHELSGQLAAAGFPGTPLPEPEAPRSKAWRVAWTEAGGALKEVTSPQQWLTAGDPAVAALLAQLGAPAGIEVNSIHNGQSRTDPTIDHLSLLRARDVQRYVQVVSQLAAPPRCLAEQILLSHQAYVDERFGEAAAGYAEVLLRLPHDIDLWRDFAFALRHLGEVALSETAVFRLPEVVERALACELNLAVLNRLRPARRAVMSPSAELLAGLLDWIAHDTDHR